jgi:hypothetical protein
MYASIRVLSEKLAIYNAFKDWSFLICCGRMLQQLVQMKSQSIKEMQLRKVKNVSSDLEAIAIGVTSIEKI